MDIQNEMNLEHKVRKGLADCGVNLEKPLNVGAAVSGGADSICMLTLLKAVLPENANLFVLTINHNLRSLEETGGDADFVESYCRHLGVFCTRVDVPRGKIFELAEKRFMGIEEAARKIRYEIFESFIGDHSLDYMCLAHNFNDQTETVLMRFLQGSGTGELKGIPMVREKYIRPILGISRKEIENYLYAKGISFRIDSTNSDNSMLRNCIRNEIVPFLDDKVNGWKNAVVNLAHKCSADEEFIDAYVNFAVKQVEFKVERDLEKGNVVYLNRAVLAKQHNAIQRRIIYRAISVVGASYRVPYTFVERMIDYVKASGSVGSSAGLEKVMFSESAAGILISGNAEQVVVQKNVKVASESVFFVTVLDEGRYELGPWSVEVERVVNDGKSHMILSAEGMDGATRNLELFGLEFPFALRSRQYGDEILGSDQTMKSVAKIISNWKKKNADESKTAVPVIQKMQKDDQSILCIWGQLMGFDNWTVKSDS